MDMLVVLSEIMYVCINVCMSVTLFFVYRANTQAKDFRICFYSMYVCMYEYVCAT